MSLAITNELFDGFDLYQFIEFDLGEITDAGCEYGIPATEVEAMQDRLTIAAERALDEGRENLIAHYGLELTWQGDQPYVSGDHGGRIPDHDADALHEWADAAWERWVGDHINTVTEAVVREAVAAWSAR
ncbi:hypothetical protein JRG19_10035 [Pseudoclavibacter alba]|uniref:hypothetical protein n=1 Tax=Pseudoclavibacter albus TaxID=272241 RepID=UPI0019D19B75|nr:hypothetical protein [Pseudoclavibacter alba]MBN6778868.1 hypothetical protein [Pseudoclavibacter alba]